MSLSLPPIGLQLPPAWDEESETAWIEMGVRATRLEEKTIAGGTLRDDAALLRPLLLQEDFTAVLALLTSTRMARALAWLWVERDGDCRHTINPLLLQGIGLAPHSRAAVHFLVRVYLERFDHTGEETLATLRTLLAAITKPQPERELRGVVGAFGRHGTLLLNAEAPRILARHAKAASLTYSEALKHFGIDGFMAGRFGELVRQHIILEELSTVSMGETTPLLEDVQQPAVHDAPHRDGLLFGHAVLMTMIDRVGDEVPSDVWSQAVIAIAGDPRRDYGDLYGKWWPPLTKTRAQTVTRWIAAEELALFLKALRTFAEDDEDMSRMYPPRKLLLEGLLLEKRVRSSRLFLGDDARTVLQRMTGTLSRGSVLTGYQYRKRALIYLDCGDFHLIEGSHNTRLWIYLKPPPGTITDQRRLSYSYQDLTADLSAAFRRDHVEGDRYSENFVHSRNWQHRVLGYLGRNGRYVNPESVLTRSDYQRFRASEHYPFAIAAKPR